MNPHPRSLTAFLSALSLSGCCTMSQGLSALFCGPRPPLPRRSYLTPEQALGTLLGAIASDDSLTIWQSVGPDMKRRMGVGEAEWEIAWQRLKKETPGIHLADQADRSDPVVLPPGPGRRFELVVFHLTLAGTHIEVTLRRYAYYKTVYRMEGTDEVLEESDYVDSVEPMLEIRSDGESFPIDIRSPGLSWEASKSEILTAGVGVEWLVYGLSVNPESRMDATKK